MVSVENENKCKLLNFLNLNSPLHGELVKLNHKKTNELEERKQKFLFLLFY